MEFQNEKGRDFTLSLSSTLNEIEDSLKTSEVQEQ